LNPILPKVEETSLKPKGSTQNLMGSKSSLANAGSEALKTNTSYFYGVPKTYSLQANYKKQILIVLLRKKITKKKTIPL